MLSRAGTIRSSAVSIRIRYGPCRYDMHSIQYTCTRLKASNSNFEFQKPCECFVFIYTVNPTNTSFKTRLIFPQNLMFNIIRIKLNMPKY